MSSVPSSSSKSLSSSPSLESLENLKLEENKDHPGADSESDEEEENSPSSSPSSSPSPSIDIYANDPIKFESYGGWGQADWTQLKVRGPHYYENKEKIRARRPLFRLVKAEVVSGKDRIFHIAKEKDLFIDQMYKDKEESKAEQKPSNLRYKDKDFVLVVNFLVPSNPSYNVVSYFQRQENNDEQTNNSNSSSSSSSSASSSSSPPASPSPSSPSPLSPSVSADYHLSPEGTYPPPLDQQAINSFDSLLHAYLNNDDEYRNNRLKIIVGLEEGGNWFVKKAIGNKPAILGNKISTTYHYSVGRNYYEIDVDVGSSKVGSGIFKICKSYAKGITVDMSFVLEGQTVEELPEVVIGGIRMHQIDVEGAIKR